MSRLTLRGGHFYPLDVRRALSFEEHHAYVSACVRRALAEPLAERGRNARRERRRRLHARSSELARGP